MTFATPKHMEQHRVQLMGYPIGDSQNGAFYIQPMGLRFIISNGLGWEHVSVSRRGRMPSYEDLVFARDTFWTDDVTVMQLFVPKIDHVNCHNYCLHLWRPLNQDIPRPPNIMVGPKQG